MDYLREIKKTCSRLGVGYAAFLLVGLMVQAEAGLILGVLDKMGWKGDWNTWIVLLGSIPMYLFGTLVCWLIVKDMRTGGCFFCLHQHYVHRKYYRNRPHEHREWNPGQASLKSGK